SSPRASALTRSRIPSCPLWWVQLAVLFVGIWLLSSIGAGELQYFWPIWPLTGTGIYVISMSFDRAERRKHRERGDDQTS
ncbi:MAG TPA: hypothetical protein PKM36_14205, partial [Propionibacteriaceae bacterium]|nr:hypothetical protein [Propionibacteriaceae bacterium]